MSHPQAPPPPYSQAVPGYYPQQSAAAPATTVVIHTTAPSFAPISNEPATITCPSCHAVVRTTVIRQPSNTTHLWALILCLFVLVKMSYHPGHVGVTTPHSTPMTCPTCGEAICTTADC